ncbi:very large secreted protein [Cryptosporidium ryanae]|uniref:very large secreted protein n=1 Tax=Cryptosporidium ryanae TaxID=515981 RepID=UPI00351A1482|nr:very large secreted protein [Cryptosporidium ryanae]
MRSPSSYLFFLLNLLLHFSLFVAEPLRTVFNLATSCLKHNGYGYDFPEFSSCGFDPFPEISDECILEVANWIKERESEYVNLRGAFRNFEGIGSEPAPKPPHFGEVLNSKTLYSTFIEFVRYLKSNNIDKLECQFNCLEAISTIEKEFSDVNSEFVHYIGDLICRKPHFTLETCVSDVEALIDRYLDEKKDLAPGLDARSLPLRICYNFGLKLGRSEIYLSRMSDLISFNLSIKDLLGVELNEIIGMDLFSSQSNPEIIYIFKEITKDGLKRGKTWESESLLSSLVGKDPLFIQEKANEKNRNYSFLGCLFGGDLLFKLYLVPIMKSETLCKLFFEYRGVVIENKISFDNVDVPKYIESKKILRSAILANSLLKQVQFSAHQVIQNSRFNLFKCLHLIISEGVNHAQKDISDLSLVCFSIFSTLKKGEDDLFDVKTVLYASLVLKWLGNPGNKEKIKTRFTEIEAFNGEEAANSVLYALLQALSEGLTQEECVHHLGILNTNDPFLSQNPPLNLDFPFKRRTNLAPVSREQIKLICDKRNVTYKLLHKLLPFRELLPEIQKTKILIYNENSHDCSKNMCLQKGTKKVFDVTLQLFFAGDVPRGYLMNANSFSMVALRAFLKNTLSFLSQEMIMQRYKEIQDGIEFNTPLSDALTMMGISGSYTGMLNKHEQINYTSKYICGGSSDNIEQRIHNSDLVKSVGSKTLAFNKDSNTFSGNMMFSFSNCIDQYIISNWKNERYSVLKSDPILFCSAVALYLGRDYEFIQSEIRDYAIYTSYYEITGSIVPAKCMEVSFSKIKSIQQIQDLNVLKASFKDCIKNYSTIFDFLTKEEIAAFSELFSKSALEYVDRPLALHSSSVYRKLIIDVLNDYRGIESSRIPKIVNSLNPTLGFNYGQLVTKLSENNFSLKDSAIIAGFIGHNMNVVGRKLQGEFFDWLNSHSGAYIPFDNNPGLKESISNMFTGKNKPQSKKDCIEKIRELIEKHKINKNNNRPEVICEGWVKFSENLPGGDSSTVYTDLIKRSQSDVINLKITSLEPVGISTIVKVSSDSSIFSIVPTLSERGIIDPKKVTLEGIKVNSRIIMFRDFVDQNGDDSLRFGKMGIVDGDICFLILKYAEPELFEFTINWKDTNTKRGGSFKSNIKDTRIGVFLGDLIKNNDLRDRRIESMMLSNGKIIEPSKIDPESKISDHVLSNPETIAVSTFLKNSKKLHLTVMWRSPSIIKVIPEIFDKKDLISRSVSVYSDGSFADLISEVRSTIVDTFPEGYKTFGENNKFEIDYVEVAVNDGTGEYVQRIIKNNAENHKKSISDMNIKGTLLVTFSIEPKINLNIVSKSLGISHLATVTSIPGDEHKNEPTFGLYEILNRLHGVNLETYDIIIPKKYFRDKSNKRHSKVNISESVRQFDSVKELEADNSFVFVEQKRNASKRWVSIKVILKEDPNTSKNIKLRPSSTVSEVLKLLKEGFGGKINPKSLFTTNGTEIDLSNDFNDLFFSKVPLDGDNIFYLTTVQLEKEGINSADIGAEKGIEMSRVVDLLCSFGYKIEDNDERPGRLSSLKQVRDFIEELLPNLNSDRVVSEYEAYLLKKSNDLPTVFERVGLSFENNNFGIDSRNLFRQELADDHKLLDAEKEDCFDFLECLRSFRDFFFYQNSEKKVYYADLYNICKKVGHSLFRREKWLLGKSVGGALVILLEDRLLNPVDAKAAENAFLESVDNAKLLGEECHDAVATALDKLVVNSRVLSNLEIPKGVVYGEICTSIQLFVNGHDQSTGEYEKPVETTLAYRIKEAIDKVFPATWSESGLGAAIPDKYVFKKSLTSLVDFRSSFNFIKNHLDSHLEKAFLDDFPNCTLATGILIIRNLMLSSGISPSIFVRKLVQFTLEEEYVRSGRQSPGISISQVMEALIRNQRYFSSERNQRNLWFWEVVEENQSCDFNDLIYKLKNSRSYLLLLKNKEEICPIGGTSEMEDFKVSDELDKIVDFFVGRIQRKGADNPDLDSLLMIDDLREIVLAKTDLNVRDFYKKMKSNLINVLREENERARDFIGVNDKNSLDREFVPFVVSFRVISVILQDSLERGNLMLKFVKFIVYEVFLNLGIIVGNIEVEQIAKKVLEEFDWRKMTISKSELSRIIIQVFPMNSARFIGINRDVSDEVSGIILNILESSDPICYSGTRTLSVNGNFDMKDTPRMNFFKSLKSVSSFPEIENTNEILLKRGYPPGILTLFNSHIAESTKMYNNDIVHIGRLGKTLLTPKQQHIGAILLSYGYKNVQGSLMNNFDHIHCFNSVLGIITDNPKRVDHYYQICMSICIEVNEINHNECEKLTIQTISSELLKKERNESLEQLIRFLGYDTIFESDLGTLRAVLLDEKSGRMDEVWVDCISNSRRDSNFHTFVGGIKNKLYSEIRERGMELPHSGFAFFELVGELVSLWTRETVDDHIKRFLTKEGHPLKFFNHLSRIWPGDGYNRINIKISKPTVSTVNLLRKSLLEEIANDNVLREGYDISNIEQLISSIARTFNIKLLEKEEDSSDEGKIVYLKKFGPNFNFKKMYSVLSKKEVSALLSFEECVNEVTNDVKDYLSLDYSDVGSFCIEVISEIFKKRNNALISKQRYSREELYFAFIYHAFNRALNHVLEGYISKVQVHNYLSSVRHDLYSLNTEMGILSFVTKFVVRFGLPVDPNIMGYYLMRILLNPVATGAYLNQDKSVRVLQNVPDQLIFSTGFYNLVYQVLRGALREEKYEIQDSHLREQFRREAVVHFIKNGFNPATVGEFVHNTTNIRDVYLGYKFGSKLGMTKLSFKLAGIKKILEQALSELLESNMNKNESNKVSFLKAIKNNLTPLDRLIHELDGSSSENCIIEIMNKYSSVSMQIYYDRKFRYAKEICRRVLKPIERITHEIEKTIESDYSVALEYCEKSMIRNRTDMLLKELNHALDYFGKIELIRTIFDMKVKDDTHLEGVISYVLKKVNRASKRKVFPAVFNKWGRQSNKLILESVLSRKAVFDKIKLYLENHVFAVLPTLRNVFNKINNSDIDAVKYQNAKRTLSKTIISIAKVTKPYSVPNFIKDRKLRSEYINELKYFLDRKSNMLEGEIRILGIQLRPYYLKISWYTHYLVFAYQEIKSLLNQLPNVSPKKTKTAKRKTEYLTLRERIKKLKIQLGKKRYKNV